MKKFRRCIPNSLRRCRKARGLSQWQAAKFLNLRSTSMLSRWELGRALPSSRNMIRLAALYRTLVDRLFDRLYFEARKEVERREQEWRARHQPEDQAEWM